MSAYARAEFRQSAFTSQQTGQQPAAMQCEHPSQVLSSRARRPHCLSPSSMQAVLLGAEGHPQAAALSTQNLLCWEEGFEAAVKSQLLSPDL